MGSDSIFAARTACATNAKKSSLTPFIPSIALAAAALLTLAACESPHIGTRQTLEAPRRAESAIEQLRLLNRVTWGANASSARRIETAGIDRYIEQQLRPAPAVLPPEV